MTKTIKTIIIVILIAAAGYFAYQKFVNSDPVDSDLERMKESILTEPKLQASDLSENDKKKYLDQYQKAKQELIQANLDSLQGVNAVAQIKRILGDIDGAITAWEYANIIRPKNSLSFSNLAALYHYDLKQYDKAEENYITSIINDPDDIPTIRNFFELYYYSMKDNVKAEALLLTSIEHNPNHADLFTLAGNFYAETGRPAKAIEYYEKHLVINPSNEVVKREVERLKAQTKNQ